MDGELCTSPPEIADRWESYITFSAGGRVGTPVNGVVVVAAEVARGVAMKSAIIECALLLVAVAVWAELALARSYLNCATKKVVIRRRAEGKYFVEHRRELGLLD
jgi:hypothetical protein